MLVAGAVSLTGHALAVSHIVRAGGRDAWLTGPLAFPLALTSIWSLVRLSRIFPGMTVAQYAPKVIGPPGYLLSIAYLTYYLAAVIFTLRLTTDWLVDTILPATPPWVMGTVYMTLVLYCALGGLDVLARTNQFTLPLLTALGLLVSFGSMHAKDYGVLAPFLENGSGPVVSATVLSLGYFGEASILAMFNAYVTPKDRPRTLKAYTLALLFLLFTLTGPIAGSIATLGYRAVQSMPYPTFQHWLMVTLARFFERSDLLAVHQWLAGAFVRCGLFLLMSVHGIRQLTGSKLDLRWGLVVASAGVVAGSALLFASKPVVDQFVQSVYLPTSAVLGILVPPLLLGVAWLRGLARTAPGVKSREA